jgi:hypothetical protein
MVFNGIQWVSMGFNGFQWVSMGFNGFQWVSMGFNGFDWVWMGFVWFFEINPPFGRYRIVSKEANLYSGLNRRSHKRGW